MLGNCPVPIMAPPCARPTPRNRPGRSNSLSQFMTSRVSSSGKSSTRMTTPSHSRRKPSGRRANASSARCSKSASDGAARLDQSVIGSPELELHPKQIGEDYDADQGEGTADTTAPKLRPVGAAVRLDGSVAPREVPAEPPPRPGDAGPAKRLGVALHALEGALGAALALVFPHGSSGKRLSLPGPATGTPGRTCRCWACGRRRATPDNAATRTGDTRC